LATIKDVAKKAGVSTGTVDRILHNRGRFSTETAQRVYAAVKELGYEPNMLARNLSISRTCRLAVLIPYPEQDSGYWALPREGMDEALSALSPYGVALEYFHFDRYDSASCGEAAGRIARSDCDGMIMAPLRDGEARSLIGKKHVPAIFIDTDLQGSGRIAYVGQDSRSGGALAARLLNLLSRGREGSFLILAPQTENFHLSERIKGFREKIEQEAEILATGIEAFHDKADFHAALDRVIGPETAGIYVVDASAHYVAEYLKEKGLTTVPLIGFDLVEENRKMVRDGVIDFILTQQPREQGFRAVNLLYRCLMLGEESPGDQIMVSQIITKENLPD
jgi:LacI family transcriptional regulator